MRDKKDTTSRDVKPDSKKSDKEKENHGRIYHEASKNHILYLSK